MGLLAKVLHTCQCLSSDGAQMPSLYNLGWVICWIECDGLPHTFGSRCLAIVVGSTLVCIVSNWHSYAWLVGGGQVLWEFCACTLGQNCLGPWGPDVLGGGVWWVTRMPP
jgi:hypothetical protein